MAYKARYRTYRPSTFEEVAGQKPIVKTLKNALINNKIAHAYLFCGPRGTGKTTMARLFAKALNCVEGQGHICNECESCNGVNTNSHPDVIEIDAASNNGVEEVRSLIEKVRYSPMVGKYKVYIIDEVHMMTPGAFNALLKTLEEPPSHVVFIMATTEPHKVLPTIVSRCQRYDFGKVDDSSISEKLIEILNQENIQYEDKAISAIVSLADGGVRDALSILDQVLAYSGSSLNEQDVLNLFGITSVKEKIGLILNINKGEVAEILQKINIFVESGTDIKRLVSDLIEVLKDVLIYNVTKEDVLLQMLKEDDAITLSKELDTKTINYMIKELIKCQSDFKNVANIKSLLEVVLLRLATSTGEEEIVKKEVVKEIKKVEIKPINKVVENKKEEIVQNNNDIPDWMKNDVEKEDIVKAAPIINPTITNTNFNNEGEQNKVEDHIIIKLMVSGNKDDRLRITEHWSQTFTPLKMHPKFGKVATLLNDGRPYLLAKNVLLLEYDFDHLAQKINIKSNQEIIRQMLEPLVGRKVSVYALPRSETVRLQRTFFSLRQISKLPAKDEDIKLDF